MKKHTTKATRQKSAGKKKYRVRNWREYNEALVNRGKVTFWVAEDALQQWQEKQKTGKRGKPKFFSNTAIETALTVREVFRLPLRQTEGFLASILERMGALVTAPDYSTLSVRSETLPVIVPVRTASPEPLHLVFDSSGIKVYGEGEWKVRKHGWSKHRTWRKLHLGVDEATNDLLLGEVSGNDAADCQMFTPLLSQMSDTSRIAQVSADGAYDKRICYEALAGRSVPVITIPPQKKPVSDGMATPRELRSRGMKPSVASEPWGKQCGSARAGITGAVLPKPPCSV
jgi:hypothetical protein